ncbi:MAG: DHA1 family tetracycline resistance protein-like MFS transporter [Patiriisocius sp.]|jgi:DHA1 family tetracycline resistance protein-like MFS transporter
MKNNKSALVFIFATVLIDIIGIGIIIPVIPALINDLSGMTLNEAAEIGGWMMVCYALMQFLFSPVLGELSDRFGRKPILLIALFGLSIDYIIQAQAPSIFWLFVARFLAGITGASHTVATAYIADISSKENKAKNFGMIGAAFGLGFIIGPAIGGIFGAIDIRLPFYIAAGLAFANFVFGLVFVPESLTIENRRKIEYKKMLPGVSLFNLGQYKSFGLLLFALFLANLAGQALPSTWTYFTMEMYGWNEAEVGYSLSAVGFLVAIVQGLLVGVSVKKFGSIKTVKIGFVFWTIGMFLFSVATEPWMIYAFLIPYSLGGIAGPTLQSMLSNQMSDNEQGNLQGSITSMISITTIIGPLLASQLFYVFGNATSHLYFPGAPYLASGIIFLVGAFIVFFALSKLTFSDIITEDE